MDRRNFILKSTMGALAFSILRVPDIFKDTPMGVVVYSYGRRFNPKMVSNKFQSFSDAIDLMVHCQKIGAGGIQIGVNNWTADFSKKVRESKEKLGLYLEGSISLPANEEELTKFEQEVKNAKEAGAKILRTVCAPGRRYEIYHTSEEFQEFKKNALVRLKMVEPVLRKHQIKLGIENHKDWRANELVQTLKQLDSEWMGATLDFGNNIALLEDPIEVVETIAPYIFSAHIKDMAVQEYPQGFLLSEVPLGEGILDLPKIVSICRQHNPDVNFSLEMITRDPLEIPCLTEEYWASFKGIPGSDLARTLKMVRQNEYKTALPRYSHLSVEDQLAAEEDNVRSSFEYSKKKL
jgi:3-oxoisoapionate decarboxylase